MRDPVALTVSGPRFLTLGDQARLELAVHNVEGPAGAYAVTGTYESEPGSQSQPGFERSVSLGAGERKREAFQLKPGEVGLTTLAVRVTGPDGIDVRRTPDLRRQGAGRRHQAPDGELARRQGRQDHARPATSSTT